MLPSCREFLDDESGATGTEYILIAAIVSFAAFTAFSILERNWTGAGVFRAQDLLVLLGGWASG
jgi:Flp pilus assembly pilin Flp